MARRNRLPRGSVALLVGALTAAPLRAHEEWNNLHLSWGAKTVYVYPFDGRNPKVAVSVLNHHEAISPEVTLSLAVNGTRMTDAGGFMTFPNGGNVVVFPDNFGLASAGTSGVYDGRAGAAPSVGETKEYTFDFEFRLAPGAVAAGDTAPTLAYTQSQAVRFINLGDSPTLAGPLGISGTVRLASSPANPPAIRIEVATPYSHWFPVTNSVPSGTSGIAFSQALPARDDWQVRFSADGYETRVVPVGYINDPHDPFAITLAPAAVPDVDYRRAVSVSTSTGFWRGAVSETEGTFVAFPGQENWKSTGTDAAARDLRNAARIYKYKFDGTRVWEHSPGWETWGGDMTPDGRFVAYVLNPTIQPFYTPTVHKLVLLDGATGAVIWTKTAPPNDPAVGRKLESLELAFSPDARWIAVGSTTGGAVTLVERASGNFLWTTPGSGPSFGQVRKLRFSADAQFLYVGSGDSTVRKLRVGDGSVLWRNFAGGWPLVNGLDLTPDGAWLVAGTKSLDSTVFRTVDGFMQWQRETQSPDAMFSPDGRHTVTAGGQIYRTLDGSLAGMTKFSGPARFTPDGRYVVQFDQDVRLFDLGGKLLRTFESSGINAAPGEQPQWSYLTQDGRYAVVLARDMSNPPQTGIVIYERRSASAAGAPVIAAQPLSQTIAAGGTATIAVNATGATPLSYQWRKNGADIPAPAGINPLLVISSASALDAGSYTCVVTNAAGVVSSNAAALSVAGADTTNPSRLANLAVRSGVTTSAPLIVGFSIGGAGTAGTKMLLIRGAGPSLTPLGVAGVLNDPRLGLFSGTTRILANDNWADDPQIGTLTSQLGAFPFTSPASRDAALAALAVGGSYTAQLASADDTSGIALAEIYDGSAVFNATTPRLVNVSARTEVSSTNVLIAGFVIAGPTAKNVLVRGIGPGLSIFNVSNVLSDPQLTLFRDGIPVASNNDWYEATNATTLATAATQVGAFSLPPGSHDAALLLSLPAGSYTAQVTAGPQSNASGSALVEIYEVP